MQLRTFYLCTILQSRQKESVKVHQNIILSIGLYRCKMLIYSERTKIRGIWKLKCWGDGGKNIQNFDLETLWEGTTLETKI